MGINMGTRQNDQFGKPQPAGGATVNLGAYYYNSGNDTNFSGVGGPYSQATVSGFGTVNVVGGEPILFFSGTPVPEPATFSLLITTSIAILRRQRSQTPLNSLGALRWGGYLRMRRARTTNGL